MREVIIADLTRFAAENKYVCTAAIDTQTGKRLRPMPYFKSETCKELGIHLGAILTGDLSYTGDNTNPHVEDASYKTLEYQGACSGEQSYDVLEHSLSNSVDEGVRFNFALGEILIPHDQQAKCSIITIKVSPNKLNIHEDHYKPEKINASFTDNNGHIYNYLSITDRGFHDCAKNHQSDGKLYEVANLIEAQYEVFLRVRLSRAFLQVNGIYTFSHFHEALRSYE